MATETLFSLASGLLSSPSQLGGYRFLNAANDDAPWVDPPVGAQVTVAFEARNAKSGWSGPAPHVVVFFGRGAQPPHPIGDLHLTPPLAWVSRSYTVTWPSGATNLYLWVANYQAVKATGPPELRNVLVTVTNEEFSATVTLGSGGGWLRGVGRAGPPPGVEPDFGVRLACYDPLGDLRGRVRARSIERYATTGGPGTLKIGVAALDPGVDLLADPVEVAVELWDGTTWSEPDDARYMAREVEDSDPPDAIRTVDVSCVGIAALLSGALVWSAPAGQFRDNKRILTGTPGETLLTLLAEAQARGCLPGIAVGFSAGADSGGRGWGSVTVEVPLSASLLDVLGELRLPWWMTGRTLHVGDRGLDLASGLDPVHLRRQMVAHASDKTDWAGLADAALMVGEAGLTWAAHRPTTPTPWGRREVAITSRAGTAQVAEAALDYALTLAESVPVQHTREWSWEPGRTRWMPDRDIGLYDWVLIDGPAGAERVQVEDLMVRSSPEGIEVFVTAGTVHADLLERLARKLAALETAAMPPPGGAGPAPKAPEGSDAHFEWHANPTRRWVQVVWPPVTQDTNDDPIAVESYRVEAQYAPLNQWKTAWEGRGGMARWTPPDYAVSVETRVYARSDRGVESEPGDVDYAASGT